MDGSRYMFIINYGGLWKSTDGKSSYVNGQVGHVDNVDSDRICYLDILNDFYSLVAIPPGSIVTINYRIPGWDLEEHLGVLGCENDVMDMFAIHGDLRKIIFYITYTEAKCVSMDDGCNGKGKEQMQDDDDDDVDYYVIDDVADHSHGNDEGLDGHHDIDDGEFEGLYDDGEDYSYDDGKDYLDDDGGEDDDDGDQESSDGGDHEGPDEDDGNEGVHDGGGADLSDYEPTSEYGCPRERGNTLDFDFSKPIFWVALLTSNPGSVVKLYAPLATEEDTYGVFKRVFICLIGPRDGFLNGYRKIIGLDGCHTKTGAIGGIILIAIGIDGNNGIFLIAYSVVEAKSRDNWTRFLVELRDALGIDDPHR
uniref:PB1-like domain-containing protein n=1 Tax=Nelumbo nucifera TaxID=4432 RepID=A0A822XT31_NELNU|nr:TPA_asm: hypothetical protein HUJ06_023784 [Nelumbo nucifera]